MLNSALIERGPPDVAALCAFSIFSVFWHLVGLVAFSGPFIFIKLIIFTCCGLGGKKGLFNRPHFVWSLTPSVSIMLQFWFYVVWVVLDFNFHVALLKMIAFVPLKEHMWHWFLVIGLVKWVINICLFCVSNLILVVWTTSLLFDVAITSLAFTDSVDFIAILFSLILWRWFFCDCVNEGDSKHIWPASCLLD